MLAALALVVPLGLAGAVSPVMLVLLVTLASIPAWAPVALSRSGPNPGTRALAAIGAWIDRNGRSAIVLLLLAAALFFLARGVIRLVA